jgi:hypothetical protein
MMVLGVVEKFAEKFVLFAIRPVCSISLTLFVRIVESSTL